MKFKFREDCEIEVINSFNEALDDAESTIEVFRVGEIVHFDIIDHPTRWNGRDFVEDATLINLQFPNGSVAFGVSSEWLERI